MAHLYRAERIAVAHRTEGMMPNRRVICRANQSGSPLSGQISCRLCGQSTSVWKTAQCCCMAPSPDPRQQCLASQPDSSHAAGPPGPSVRAAIEPATDFDLTPLVALWKHSRARRRCVGLPCRRLLVQGRRAPKPKTSARRCGACSLRSSRAAGTWLPRGGSLQPVEVAGWTGGRRPPNIGDGQ